MGLAHLASKDRATALRLRQRAGTRRRETRWREHHDRMHPTQHPVRPLPLGLLVRGRTLPYIANELFVTTGTVKTHVRHIYEKSLVNNRQELLDKVEAR